MQNISTNTLCVGYLLRIYISTNIPQYSFITQMYGSEHTARRRGRFIAPVFQPNQMVLMCRNDANCNAILCNYVGTVWGIPMPMVENRNAILWVFVGTGTINRTPTPANGLALCNEYFTKYVIFVLRLFYVCSTNVGYWHCKNHTFAM